MGVRIRPLAFALSSLAILSSCATGLGGVYGIRATPKADRSERRLIAVPATLKVLQSQSVTKSWSASIEISEAKGEAESAQLIFYADADDEAGLRFEAADLIGPGGTVLKPELGIVGYVPLKHPTIVGFHRKGDYPDPILPASDFSVRAGQGQSLWYTVRAPRDAASGVYEGSASVVAADGSRISLPVRVAVRNVTLPKTSFLKTSINFRKESARDGLYYGDDGPADLDDALGRLGLEYRFSHRVDLPLLEAFSRGPDGNLSADWTAFDERAAYWLDQGITCFELKLPISFAMKPDEIRSSWGQKLAAIDEHLVEKNWTELFYYYFYDEPFRREMPAMAARLDAIREFAPHVPNVLTYGITTSGQKKLEGKIGIWVPNLHQFDPKFAKERQAAGEQVWAYACVGNVIHAYPDNFRIDWYGAEHRALGWWLYKNGIQGYLYWAVDLWRRNPWKTTETFDWTNGDGVLFYPALDKKSLPYPSIRAHLMRDAFEDYDLLSLLRQAYGDGDDAPAEVKDLLSAKEIFPRPNESTKDDGAYIRCHDRILDLLEDAHTNR
jgi:hypothetical protein